MTEQERDIIDTALRLLETLIEVEDDPFRTVTLQRVASKLMRLTEGN